MPSQTFRGGGKASFILAVEIKKGGLIMKRTGAQIVWEGLLREGVEIVFGIPGGAILPVYDAYMKYEYPIRHVLARHEQCAGHMADGYARATGRIGVCMVTSGPAATNLVTGLATAYMDSVPIVAITGQVPTSLLGRDGFQEADVTGITVPVTKHNYLVTDVSELPHVIREAFYIAGTGRPGPVLIDICKDAQQAELGFEWPEEEIKLPGYNPHLDAADPGQVARAAQLINEAERPLLLSGQGVTISGAYAELRELAEKANIPVATTLLGISTFPETHPLSVGMGGMHGEAFCNYALQNSDVLVVVGSRLDDRLTGAFSTFAPKAKIVHIDIDPAELGKNLTIDTPVVGDARLTLQAMLPQVKGNEHPAWLAQIAEWRGETDQRDILAQESDEMVPPYIVRQIWHSTQGDSIMVSDVGQNQMWEAQYFYHTKTRGLLSSGGLGTMGYALPAAIGAKCGKPEEEVWVTVGDGGFQMTLQELAVVVQENLDLKIALLNNGYLGMVRQWQDIFYEQRYSATPLVNPDFVKLAAAYGIPGRVVEEKKDVVEAIEEVRRTPGPFLLEFRVEPLAAVYPLVAPGKAIAEMIRRPMPSEGK
jgi:acetolactate synthase-1/2/3 large subunit